MSLKKNVSGNINCDLKSVNKKTISRSLVRRGESLNIRDQCNQNLPEANE